MSKFLNSKAVHREFMGSLKEVMPNATSPSRIKAVMQELRKYKNKLPQQYEEKALRIILKLLDEMPEVMQNNLHDSRLKALCQHCIEQVVEKETLELTPSSLKPKSKP